MHISALRFAQIVMKIGTYNIVCDDLVGKKTIFTGFKIHNLTYEVMNEKEKKTVFYEKIYSVTSKF